MAAIVTSASLAPFGTPVQRTAALLALFAAADNEEASLVGVRALILVDPSVAAMYDLVAIDARIAAI